MPRLASEAPNSPDSRSALLLICDRRSLFSRRGGVVFTDTSEAEDLGFAQAAVQRFGARVRTIPALEADQQLFVCVRHGANTWHWTEQEDKFLHSATLVPNASDVLTNDDYLFAAMVRARGVAKQLRLRRNAAPTLNRCVTAAKRRTAAEWILRSI